LPQFSEKIGVARTTVVRYRDGETPPPIDFLEKVCEEFRVSRRWLVLGEDQQFQSDRDIPVRVGTPEFDPGSVAFTLFVLQKVQEPFRRLPPDRQGELVDLLYRLFLNLREITTEEWDVLHPIFQSLIDYFPIKNKSTDKSD